MLARSTIPAFGMRTHLIIRAKPAQKFTEGASTVGCPDNFEKKTTFPGSEGFAILIMAMKFPNFHHQ